MQCWLYLVILAYQQKTIYVSKLYILTLCPSQKSKTYKQAIVPSSHITTGVDADLVIYVTASNEPAETFLAWATSCLRDSVTGRPVAGQINFNLAYLDYSASEFEGQVDTTLHEVKKKRSFTYHKKNFFFFFFLKTIFLLTNQITHILAFSGNL